MCGLTFIFSWQNLRSYAELLTFNYFVPPGLVLQAENSRIHQTLMCVAAVSTGILVINLNYFPEINSVVFTSVTPFIRDLI